MCVCARARARARVRVSPDLPVLMVDPHSDRGRRTVTDRALPAAGPDGVPGVRCPGPSQGVLHPGVRHCLPLLLPRHVHAAAPLRPLQHRRPVLGHQGQREWVAEATVEGVGGRGRARDRHTYRGIDRDRQTNRERERGETDRQTETETQREGGLTERQTEGHGTQTQTQTYRQTHRDKRTSKRGEVLNFFHQNLHLVLKTDRWSSYFLIPARIRLIFASMMLSW